jgi:adenylate cyclase
MADKSANRKMSAILSADVKGYSRLMSMDEEGTVKALNDCREIIYRCVQDHKGRVVDSPGDNVLAEFVSTVEAVKCAVKMQANLKSRNADLSENRKMEFRIGVNLGDVIEEDGRIYGEGVNIAARLEGLAEAGGICISGTAFDHVKGKLEVGYQYLGAHNVKNIPEPVQAYKILVEPEAVGKVIGKKRKKGWIAIAAVVVILIGVTGWFLYLEQSKRVEPASIKNMVYPLPDKPSIAVLPFDNMSGDPTQEYFSDGLAEEIITALAKVPGLFVIARNSSFTYKGKPVKVQQVSEELGVRYVLEGSVRKSENQLRITAQLIDAIAGNHLWAERYDRELKDLFSVQDDVTLKILTSLQVVLAGGERARLFAKGTGNLEAYLKLIDAREHLIRLNQEDNSLARSLCEEAIALDPQYAGAYGLLSRVYVMDFVFRTNPKDSLKMAYEYARKAIDLDDTQLNAYLALEFMFSFRRQHDEAIASGERAVKFAPGAAEAYLSLGRALSFAGRDREALGYLEKAIRMNPFPPAHHYMHLGFAYNNLGNYEEAISAFKKAIALSPKIIPARLNLIVSYVQLGRMQEAKTVAEEILKIDPKFTSKGYGEKRSPWKDHAVIERQIESWRKFGLERNVDPN